MSSPACTEIYRVVTIAGPADSSHSTLLAIFSLTRLMPNIIAKTIQASWSWGKALTLINWYARLVVIKKIHQGEQA